MFTDPVCWKTLPPRLTQAIAAALRIDSTFPPASSLGKCLSDTYELLCYDPVTDGKKTPRQIRRHNLDALREVPSMVAQALSSHSRTWTYADSVGKYFARTYSSLYNSSRAHNG